VSICVAEQVGAPGRLDAETDRPALSVVLAVETIKENDAFDLEVWLRNEKDLLLVEAKLHTTAPPFLSTHDAPCSDKSRPAITGGSLELGPIPPASTTTRRLCMRSKAITPGDFNLVFTVAYAWDRNGKRQDSFVTIEKPLKVRLFGSDSIAGIPLNLAAFIVPGLVFWLVLSHLGVPWAVAGVALGDRMVYSLLISILLLLIVGDWMKLIDLEAAIGTAKFATLALVGLGAGLVVAGLHHAVSWVQRFLERSRYIRSDDDLYTKLEKLLAANRDYQHPKATVKVTENGSRKYVGTLAATMGGKVWLAGSFRLVLPAGGGKIASGIKKDYQAGNLAKVVHAARRHKLQITVRNLIQEARDTDLEPTDHYLRSWPTGTIEVEEDPNKQAFLELVETPEGRLDRPSVNEEANL
jgi:hypothetical protein